MKKKHFIKELINANLQIKWLAEYNIEVARDTIRESIKRVPYLEREIKKKEEEQKKMASVDVKEGMTKAHYEKVKEAKDYLKDLAKEVKGEEEIVKASRASILAHKRKIVQADMLIEAQTAHLKIKEFNFDEEIDKEPGKEPKCDCLGVGEDGAIKHGENCHLNPKNLNKNPNKEPKVEDKKLKSEEPK